MPAYNTPYIDRQLSRPAEDGEVVVIGTPFSKPSRSLFVGTGGNINIVMAGGTTLLHKNVVAGTILPVAATNISATNTTAADIIAYF